MIAIIIKDINGKELNLNSKVQMVNEETEEVYGEISSVRLVVTEDNTFEIRAFENNFTYTTLSNSSYSQPFLIVE